MVPLEDVIVRDANKSAREEIKQRSLTEPLQTLSATIVDALPAAGFLILPSSRRPTIKTCSYPVVIQPPNTMVAFFVILSCMVIASAEHSGAYSSPQYAKKMFPNKSYDYDTNVLLPKEKPPIPFKESADTARYDSGNDTTQYGRSSLMESAGNFFSGTGGQVMSSLARDFIARSTGSSQVGFDCVSQVLSLNLTNLVILIVLKALILAAGFFGAGAWKGGHSYGRSLDDNKNASFITEEEIMLYLSYLAGQHTKNYGCLYLLSCQRPHQAGLYASGAELLLQGAKLMQGNDIELDQYENISENIKQAADWGEKGMNCDTRYKCGQ